MPSPPAGAPAQDHEPTPPIQPIYLLADSQLLFWSDEHWSFARAIRERIATNTAAAAYIGASNGDDPTYYSIFTAAMHGAGIRDCRMISSEFGEADEGYLRGAELILLAGGNPGRGWRIMQETGMSQVVIERHYRNAVVVGVSAGAVLLGVRGWAGEDADEPRPFDGLQLVPCVVDAHDEAHQWARLRKLIRTCPGFRGIGLGSGGGAIYHPDGALEPVRRPVTEFALRDEGIVHTLLMPGASPRS